MTSTPVEQVRGEPVDQDLTAVPGGHHPGCAVERGAEVVVTPLFGFTGRDAHPDRQFQRALRGDGRVDRRLR